MENRAYGYSRKSRPTDPDTLENRRRVKISQQMLDLVHQWEREGETQFKRAPRIEWHDWCVEYAPRGVPWPKRGAAGARKIV